MPNECTEALPSSLSITTEGMVNATAGGNTASWSLVNSSGSVVLSQDGSNLSFNSSLLPSGNYTIKAVGRNSCGFQFDLSQVYVKTSSPFIEMVNIPGGTFQMGDTRGEGDPDEKPIRNVTLSSFRIGKYEVTQAQWQTVMGNNPSGFQNCPNCPVEQVSWLYSIEFCNRLSDREGRQRVYSINGDNVTANWSADGYRLPTEAEWEYAAGGGMTNRTRFGNGRDILDTSEANFNPERGSSYSNSGIYRQSTVGVGSLTANRLGLYEMSGNIYEWCWDWYGIYSSQPEGNTRGPLSGSIRVLRGGSWLYPASDCRVTNRGYGTPSDFHFNVGFRVVTQN